MNDPFFQDYHYDRTDLEKCLHEGYTRIRQAYALIEATNRSLETARRHLQDSQQHLAVLDAFLRIPEKL